MMKTVWFGLLALVSSPAVAAPETPYGFVSLYLHEVASIDLYRRQAAQNQSARPRDMAGCVHDTEAWRLEIIGAARTLSHMALPASNPAQAAPQLIAQGLEAKGRSVGELGEICAHFIGEPRDGVDYNAIAARAPKVRAQLEATDKALFEGAVLAFASLISMKPDSAGHASFLVINSQQRDTLLKLIQNDFGDQIEKPDQGYAIEIAKLFRDKLREYHAADERSR